MAVDLATLEFLRHLHKYGGVSQIVRSAEAAAQALADGWHLVPPQTPPEPAPTMPPEPVPTPEPVPRWRSKRR